MKRLFSGIGAFLQTPIGVIFTTNVVWQIVMRVMQIPTYGTVYYVVSGVILLLDFIAAFLLRGQLIHFFSQFVLPIQNPKYRQDIAARVSNFETGSRGPALFVKNGCVITHADESEKRGPGLIVLDTASALVLRTDTEIKDTVGPGVVFTKSYKHNGEYHNEYIAGSVDLRSQWQFIGPLTTDQPFLNPVPISSPKEYNETQSRRQQTSGLTRDGFEVSPTSSTPEPSTPSGITFPWDTTVIPLVISELEELIVSHTLSEILASISQKEVDSASKNDQTIVQMRLEMTGQQMTDEMRKESPVPKFESRSRITAQFFDSKFKEKAAKLGVSVEWIDIGTWQLPSSLILEKHKEAWNLARVNAKKRSDVERSRKKQEMKEILKLVDNVVIRNYDKKADFRKKSNEELEKLSPQALLEYRYQAQQHQQGSQKKNPTTIAQEILNAFRMELRAAKPLIENETKPPEEKQADLARIEKALNDISPFTPSHWINKP